MGYYLKSTNGFKVNYEITQYAKNCSSIIYGIAFIMFK